MNEKIHCRENCRYHYSLLRELINNQNKQPHFVIRFFTQFMVYLCVVLLAVIIYNTFIVVQFINDQNFLNVTVDYIQRIRQLNLPNCNKALYATKC